MNILKRSEKLCPTCNNKNPIRCFNCKTCNYMFPRKDKPKSSIKEKEKISVNENKKIEEYLKICSQKKYEISKEKIKETRECLKESDMNLFIKNILSLKGKCKGDIQNMSEDSVNVDPVIKEEEILYKISEDSKIQTMSINFPNFDLGKNYSFDCVELKDKDLFCVISYYNCLLKKVIITCLELKHNLDKEIITNNLEDPNFKLTVKSIKSTSISIENEEIMRFSNKIIKGSPLFIFSINNRLTLYMYNMYDDNEIIKIDEIVINDLINKFDAIITDGDNISLKLVLSDYENRIYLYNIRNRNLNEGFRIISVYEKHFNYRITDLQFLPFYEETAKGKKVKSYFCASSRDGTIKIFHDLDPFKVVFFHRSTELWITRFFYDRKNELLFYFVNSYLTERIVSIKFFPNKEYCVKRIPETENSFYCQPDEVLDRLYVLKADGVITYIDIAAMIEMYTYSRSKKKYQIIQKTFFSSGWVSESKENSEEHTESLVDEKDDKMEKICTSDQIKSPLDFYSKFFLVNFIDKNSSSFNQVLIIPSLDKIKINIISKKFY